MRIFDSIRKTEYSTVVALGFFDGVHIGHKQVINTCINNCDENSKSVVFTFKESPHNTLSKTKKPLLTNNEQKFEHIEKLGVDEIFCVDFESVMDLSADEFVRDILSDKLNAKCVVTGFNYRFSKGGKADADELAKLCAKYNIRTIKCEPVVFKGESVSSTRIRQCIANGDIQAANAMLGYDFVIDTHVRSGNHIGTKINSPTINQRLHTDVVVPKLGVYATMVTVKGKTYIGATNIGTHPTVGQCEPVCETHLLSYDGADIYGESVQTKLVCFVRAEQKFDGIDELVAQIEKDTKTIEDFFKNKSTV